MNRGIRGSLVAFAFVGALFTTGRALAEDSVAGQCPGYAAHLTKAKARLLSGDQRGAIEELQGAREALSTCIREEAEQQSEGTRLVSAPSSRSFARI